VYRAYWAARILPSMPRLAKAATGTTMPPPPPSSPQKSLRLPPRASVEPPDINICIVNPCGRFERASNTDIRIGPAYLATNAHGGHFIFLCSSRLFNDSALSLEVWFVGQATPSWSQVTSAMPVSSVLQAELRRCTLALWQQSYRHCSNATEHLLSAYHACGAGIAGYSHQV